MFLKNFGTFIKGRRYFSADIRQFKEVEIKVPWGFIRGKWWEPYLERPIICLHGYQVCIFCNFNLS